MDEWVDGCTDGPMGVGQTDEQTEDGQITRMESWLEGETDGQMEEWIDKIELTNGWMDK